MNVYVTNCKVNMIECVQSFFFFLHFCSPMLSVSWQMKINLIPTYFSKRACSTKDLFYRKKTYQRILKEPHKKTSNLPVGGEMCVLYTGQFFLA